MQRLNVASKRRFARAILEDRETTRNVIVCNYCSLTRKFISVLFRG